MLGTASQLKLRGCSKRWHPCATGPNCRSERTSIQAFASLSCAYGIDGATYHLNNPAHPGCSERPCDPANPMEQNGFCGFNGSPANSWAPRDLKLLLELHADHGAQYRKPGFHSGYNEVILSSKMHNARLPHAIEAFFFIEGQSPVTGDLGYGIIIDVRQAHRSFLQLHGLSAAQVPLLSFNPNNWQEPFRRVE